MVPLGLLMILCGSAGLLMVPNSFLVFRRGLKVPYSFLRFVRVA